ncbi:MAG TPA: hypothetical protein HPP83_11690, partial [Candidatus Hydrogenedentes bacterium]|nr:hypothetical protein [Candidatus Hydrogenedentota bacterium]
GYFIAGPSVWAQSWGRAHNGDGTRYNYSLVGLGTGAEEISNTISNALFEGNTIIDAEVMLETHTSDDLVVRNNVLTTQDTSTSSRIKVYAPGVKSGPIQDLLITHNTITAARNAVRVNPIFEVSPYELEAFEGRVRHENIVIEQNVIIMDADKSRVISFRENDADQIAEVNTDENIVYWTDETELFQAGGDVVAPGDLYSLAEWRTLTGMDSGTQVYTSNDLPVPGWATSPPEVRDFPIAVAYTGATDNSGTGLAEVRLWVKIATGDWEDTGLTSTGEQGSFNYTDASSDGSPATYYFALQAEDNNTNVSPAPIGDNGHCSTEYDPL